MRDGERGEGKGEQLPVPLSFLSEWSPFVLRDFFTRRERSVEGNREKGRRANKVTRWGEAVWRCWRGRREAV